MYKNVKSIIIVGGGNFAFGALILAISLNKMLSVPEIIYVRDSEKWHSLRGKKHVTVYVSTGSERIEYDISIAFNYEEAMELAFKDPSHPILLISSNESEFCIFLNNAHSILTCVGSAMGSVITDIELNSKKEQYIFTCENDYVTARSHMEKAVEGINIFPCVIDCICSGQKIESGSIYVEAEPNRRINIYDPMNHFIEVLTSDNKGGLRIVSEQKMIQRLHENKFAQINLIHRLLCYLIIKENKGKITYNAALECADEKLCNYINDAITDRLYDVGEAVALALFYIFDRELIKQELGVSDDIDLVELYLNLDYRERVFILEKRMIKQTNDTVGRIIKTDSENAYCARVEETRRNLECYDVTLKKMINDSLFKSQYNIPERDIRTAIKVIGEFTDFLDLNRNN